MTLRDAFRDGVIVPEPNGILRNGDIVEIVRARASKTLKRRPAKSKRSKPAAEFGAWKHRTDIADSAEFARQLRRRSSRGRRDA
ncbi:hypothetical protein PHYC_00322 [Phycisphaerales bacterium]|nr:hypothetical protein PHYC_00322 [Phycisphaerales bacterium]